MAGRGDNIIGAVDNIRRYLRRQGLPTEGVEISIKMPCDRSRHFLEESLCRDIGDRDYLSIVRPLPCRGEMEIFGIPLKVTHPQRRPDKSDIYHAAVDAMVYGRGAVMTNAMNAPYGKSPATEALSDLSQEIERQKKRIIESMMLSPAAILSHISKEELNMVQMTNTTPAPAEEIKDPVIKLLVARLSNVELNIATYDTRAAEYRRSMQANVDYAKPFKAERLAITKALKKLGYKGA